MNRLGHTVIVSNDNESAPSETFASVKKIATLDLSLWWEKQGSSEKKSIKKHHRGRSSHYTAAIGEKTPPYSISAS